VSQGFSAMQGALLTIIVRTGNSIGDLSYYTSENEILILPFTYFVINSYNLKVFPQVA
jgi:hypothetical protein